MVTTGVHFMSVSIGLVAGASLLLLPSMAQLQGRSDLIITAEQREILSHLSIEYLDDGMGGTAKTIRFTGVNVQIVNGMGATNGSPGDPGAVDHDQTVTNGLGNLIVGYNELGNPHGDNRTGSHNVMVGFQLNASSFGGTVIGHRNRILNAYASVGGGTDNEASGQFSTVTAGKSGTASGWASAISGGNAGIASGISSSIVGGQLNVASGLRASVLGGGSNEASAEESVVVGGGHAYIRAEGNLTNGIRSCIVGGSANRTTGLASVVSGGFGRQALGDYDWVAGGLFQDQ